MEKEFNEIPITKLVLKLGLPAMAAQFFNILYSVTDRMFIGHISNAKEMALASIGVSAPALTILAGFASLVGVGGMSLMSISVGKKDYSTAQKTLNNALLLLLVLGVLLTVGSLLARRPLLFLLGCSENMYPFANTYFKLYVLGTLAVMLGSGMNYFILGQGYAKHGMFAVTLGAVLNIILDPIFIFGCNMGIAGAAIATVISQIATMLYVLIFLCTKATITFRFGGYSGAIMARIAKIGSMSFLIILLDNGVLILLNMLLRKYGGENGTLYISCATVVQSFMVLAYFPADGIASGCGTLYSYHYGANHFDKLMDVFSNVLRLCFLYMFILCVMIQMAPGIFVRLFVTQESSIALTSSFLRMYTLGLVGTAIQYAFVDGLTAMGKIRNALPLSLFRKAVYIVSILILPLFFPVANIFWAGTIADVVGAAFTLSMFLLVVYPKLRREMSL